MLLVGMYVLELLLVPAGVATLHVFPKFNFAAFCATFSRKALFPAMRKATPLRLLLAVPCAADDLALALGDAEFFEGHVGDMSVAPLDMEGYNVPHFHDFSPPPLLALLLVTLVLLLPNEFQKPMPFLPLQLYEQFPYFSDFRPGNAAPLLVLALENLYVSPLDDEFFKVEKGFDFERLDKGSFDSTGAVDKVQYERKSPSEYRSECLERRTEAEPFGKAIRGDFDFGKKRKASYDSALPMFDESILPCLMSVPAKKMRPATFCMPDRGGDEDEMFKLLVYECTQCSASFKVKLYLTRHLRKHNNARAFMCPFFREDELDSQGCVVRAGTKCHLTGGFSRRDTYKTHLKALHFIYPPGTKLSERNRSGGRCAGCFKYFESNQDWLALHIESGECTELALEPIDGASEHKIVVKHEF